MNNELRRVHKKLKTLKEEESVNWLLFDLLDLLNEKMSDGDEFPEEQKLKLIKELEKKYLREIKKLSPIDPKQTKLW